MLQFDLVTGRDGSKYYVKPKPEPKDMSWKDSIVSVTLKVGITHGSFFTVKIILQAFVERKIPASRLPLGEEMKTRKKSAVKPDKCTAINQHQTRMKMN